MKLIGPSYLLVFLIGSTFLATVFAHLQGDKDKKGDVNLKDHKDGKEDSKHQKDMQDRIEDHKDRKDKPDDNKNQKDEDDHKQDDRNKHNGNSRGDHKRNEKKGNHGDQKDRKHDDDDEDQKHHGGKKHHGHQGHHNDHNDHKQDSDHKDDKRNDGRKGNKRDDDHWGNKHDDDDRGYEDDDYDRGYERDNDHRGYKHNDGRRVNKRDEDHRGYKDNYDNKDNGHRGRGNRKDQQHHGGHKDENKSKEEAHKEFLDILKQMLTKCKKDDHGKKSNPSHEDRDGDRKHQKDNGKKTVHHYHYYHPDGSIKTSSTREQDGSNHHQGDKDQDHHHASGDKRFGNHQSHSDEHNSRNHRPEEVYHEPTETKSHEQRHSDDQIVHHHHIVVEGNGDTVPHHPQNTHYPNSQPHGHKNEHYERRSEPRHTRHQGDYNHSHPNYEQQYHHTVGGCAPEDRAQPSRESTHYGCREDTLNTHHHSHGGGIERTPCGSRGNSNPNHEQHYHQTTGGCATEDKRVQPARESTHCGCREDMLSTQPHSLNYYGPATHTAGKPQVHQNCGTLVADVQHSLPGDSQHKQESVPCKEPITHQSPKTGQGAVAHICHYHDHIVRVEQPNRQSQQQHVDTSNSFSHQSEVKFPMDITSFLCPAPLVSSCLGVEQHQATHVCQELKPAPHPCGEPKEVKPVLMIYMQKEVEIPSEPVKVNPPPCSPPKTEPRIQPLRVDPPHCSPPKTEPLIQPLRVDPPHCSPPIREPPCEPETQYSIHIREPCQNSHKHQPPQHIFQYQC